MSAPAKPWSQAAPGRLPPAVGPWAGHSPSLSLTAVTAEGSGQPGPGQWLSSACLTPSRGSKDGEELRGEADLQGFPAEVREFLHPHLLRGVLQRPVGASSVTETHCFSAVQ